MEAQASTSSSMVVSQNRPYGLTSLWSRPAYLALPWDLVDIKIVTKRLNDKLCREELDPNADAEQAAIDHIYRRFDAGFSGELKDNVVVIADVSISRHDCKKEAADFLSVTKLPVYGTPLGKTFVDETSERYGAREFFLDHYIISNHS